MRIRLIAGLVAVLWSVNSAADARSLLGTWVGTQPDGDEMTMTFLVDGTVQIFDPRFEDSESSETTHLYWDVESASDPLVLVLAEIDHDDPENIEGFKYRIRFLTPDMIEVLGVKTFESDGEELKPDRVVIWERQ